VERRVSAIEALRGGLVVSVQAPEGSPLRHPVHMAAIARAAEMGGAVGIRANGGPDIAAIVTAVGVPVIGLNKRVVADSPVYITPEPGDVELVVDAGADVVAVDATERERPAPLGETIAAAGARPVLADVDTLAAGVAAREAGAAAVATTLAGYTDALSTHGPDVQLVRELARVLDCPVIAEGRYTSPDAVRAAFVAGAHAVVVGTAITNPLELTRRFAEAARG
jgi:putative N-acetylmannosamine-6-phosphate epimerase